MLCELELRLLNSYILHCEHKFYMHISDGKETKILRETLRERKLLGGHKHACQSNPASELTRFQSSEVSRSSVEHDRRHGFVEFCKGSSEAHNKKKITLYGAEGLCNMQCMRRRIRILTYQLNINPNRQYKLLQYRQF